MVTQRGILKIEKTLFTNLSAALSEYILRMEAYGSAAAAWTNMATAVGIVLGAYYSTLEGLDEEELLFLIDQCRRGALESFNESKDDTRRRKDPKGRRKGSVQPLREKA